MVIKSDKFWDKTADKYAKKAVPDEKIYQKKLAETQAFLSKDMHILEFGCGTGSTAIEHAPYVRKVEAIDISQKMIDIGRSRAEKAGVNNLTFTLGTLEDFNAKPASLDAVLGLNVIHLVPNRTALIAEVARILKPGGVFVSSTGCLGNSYFRFLMLLMPLLKLLKLAPDIFVIRESELVSEIKQAGFSIERQWHHGPQGITVFIIAKKR
ncbi:class I SAM-dependent methyltransferase [Thalassotalea sediminis]|uniref:class I SAM-dependent methyltransferase n=1 Tax=Thalassotalea sediminis TaxID=1759089 RepID=UPI00257483C7|nr:class I SAM-dependent methyltransferase [Thalassotalea sediminis]